MTNIGVIYTYPSEVESIRRTLARKGVRILPQNPGDNPKDMVVYSANSDVSKDIIKELNDRNIVIKQVSEIQNVNPSVISSVGIGSINLESNRYKCIFETKSPTLAITAANIAMLHNNIRLDNLVLSSSTSENTVLIFSGLKNEVEAAIKSTKFLVEKSKKNEAEGMDLF